MNLQVLPTTGIGLGPGISEYNVACSHYKSSNAEVRAEAARVLLVERFTSSVKKIRFSTLSALLLG